MIKTFYWYQLHQNLGPLAISVKKILYDLLMIILVWGVFYTAFAASIGLIMNEEDEEKSSQGRTRTKCNCPEEEEEEYNAFHSWSANNSTSHSIDGVFKTMFWVFFDPGKPEYLGPYNARYLVQCKHYLINKIHLLYFKVIRVR